jgi:hypothetical protein
LGRDKLLLTYWCLPNPLASYKTAWRLLKKSLPEKGVLSNMWWFTAFITEE